MSPANKALFNDFSATPTVRTQIDDDNGNDDDDDSDVDELAPDSGGGARSGSNNFVQQRTYATRGVSPAATVRRASAAASATKATSSLSFNGRALLSLLYSIRWLFAVALLAIAVGWLWNSVDLSEQYANSYCQSALSTLATRRGAHRCDEKVEYKLAIEQLVDSNVRNSTLFDKVVSCINKTATFNETGDFKYSVSDELARPPFLCTVQLFALDNKPAMAGIALAICVLLGIAWKRSRMQARQRRFDELVASIYENLKAQKWNHRVSQDGDAFIAVVHLRDALVKNRDDLALWPDVLEVVRANTHVAEKGQLIDGAVSDVFEWVGK